MGVTDRAALAAWWSGSPLGAGLNRLWSFAGKAFSWAQGWTRYRLYHSRWLHFLVPGHVRQQVSFRIASMDMACYERGSCVVCGCATTALQMARKACGGRCYPAMLGRGAWRRWRDGDVGTHRCAATRATWGLDRRRGRFIRLSK